MDVTVVIPVCGDQREWFRSLAETRAAPSVITAPVIVAESSTLRDARNAGLADVATEWVCFLDADDELEPGYFDAMADGTADVRAPAVRYVSGDTAADPYVPKVSGHDHNCVADCLDYGNWLVIGSLVRTDLLRSIGGFHDYPWSEDWDLWVRCRKAGATFEAVPDAVYRAHVRPDSRNRGQSRDVRLASHRAIAEANGLPVP